MFKQSSITSFALVDCNNFYVSCERAFNHNLENKPVIVLSNNDGCVVSRSNEAKVLGVRMGIPYFKIKDLVQKHNIHSLSSNYALYSDMSERVMRLLSHMHPNQEIYSIDESFLDFTNIKDRASYAHFIRKQIKQCLGLPVCIGIGSTKTLAKLSNNIAKKQTDYGGIFDYTLLNSAEQTQLLDNIDVQETWGIGQQLTDQLKSIQIKTVRHLRDSNPEAIRRRFSISLQKQY